MEMRHEVAEYECVHVVVAGRPEHDGRATHRLADGGCLLRAELDEPGEMLSRLDEEVPEICLRHGRKVADVHEVVAMDLDPGVGGSVLLADQALWGCGHSPRLIGCPDGEAPSASSPVVTDGPAICAAGWQTRVVSAAAEMLPRAPGVVAVWLGGSLATGVADVYSDVDLNVAVEDEHLDEWRGSWPTYVEACAGPLALAQAIGGDVVGGFALTAAWEHVDLVVHARAALRQPAPCRVLYDPERLLEERPDAVPAGHPYYPAEDVTLFLYLLGNLTVTLGRHELVVAHGGVGALRDLLVKVMLAENGVRKGDGQKRLNPHLTSEQRAVLEALPTPAVRAGEILGACRVIRDELVRRARRLAATTGNDFPEELLTATDQHLARHLGEAWEPGDG